MLGGKQVLQSEAGCGCFAELVTVGHFPAPGLKQMLLFSCGSGRASEEPAGLEAGLFASFPETSRRRASAGPPQPGSLLSQALDAGVPRPAGWREKRGFCRKGPQRFGALPLSSLPWAGVRWGPPGSAVRPPHCCPQLPFSVPLLSPAWPQAPLSSTGRRTYFYWEWASQRKDKTKK